MTVVHRDLPEAELHEPKGASVASDKQIYVADGAGSGAFQSVALGSVWVDKRSSPVVVTGSGAAETRTSTVITGGALGSAGVEFLANDDGTLEYSGSLNRHVHIAATLSVSRPAGTSTIAAVDLQWFDASAGTWQSISHSYIQMEVGTTASSTAIHADIMMDNGDKLAFAIENVGDSADLAVNTQYLFGISSVGT